MAWMRLQVTKTLDSSACESTSLLRWTKMTEVVNEEISVDPQPDLLKFFEVEVMADDETPDQCTY